jgi:basic membrane lipoprotein Med (substrate-binding protein (PBP1-ABC) superfamily)
MKRYDVAVTAAIVAISSGKKLTRTTMNGVANGGIALSDFHVNLPAGFRDELDALLATLRTP